MQLKTIIDRQKAKQSGKLSHAPVTKQKPKRLREEGGAFYAWLLDNLDRAKRDQPPLPRPKQENCDEMSNDFFDFYDECKKDCDKA